MPTSRRDRLIAKAAFDHVKNQNFKTSFIEPPSPVSTTSAPSPAVPASPPPSAAPTSAKEVKSMADKIIGVERLFVRTLTKIGIIDSELSRIALQAFLAELFSHANCGERALVTLMQLLKRGISAPIEQVVVADSKNPDDNHSFVVVNRTKTSSMAMPNKYGDIIVVDPRAKVDDIQTYTDAKPLTRKDLQFSFAADFTIQSIIRFEHALTRQDWQKLVKFWQELKSFITEDVVNTILKSSGIPYPNLFVDIQNKIQREINECNNIAYNTEPGNGRMTTLAFSQLFFTPALPLPREVSTSQEMVVQLQQETKCAIGF
ncbi:hypothetical protein BH10PSE19_BH10PSE19_15590 [soil metagenome]